MPEDTNVKPGFKTTEFWLTFITGLIGAGGMLSGVVPEHIGAIIMAVVTAAYTISRSIAKMRG